MANIERIREVLDQHPDIAGMFDEDAAIALSNLTETKFTSVKFTKRTLYGLFGLDAATIIQKWKAAAASNPAIADIVDMVDTVVEGGGVDVGDPIVRNMISYFVTLDPELLTQEEANTILALGEITEPVLGTVYPGWVAKARAL